MSPNEHLQVIIECQQHIHGFYAALDAGDAEAVSQAFAESGVWHRQGAVLQGPQAVRAALADRPAQRVSAHLVNNLVVTPVSATEATAGYLTLVFRNDGPHAAGAPAELGGAYVISWNDDHLRRGDDGRWRYVGKQSSPRFRQG